jgi:hypothetical protein
MISGAEPNQPSEEFMTALKELKPIWLDMDSRSDINMDWIETHYRNLIELGKKEGLSVHEVNHKLDEIVANCRDCNEQIMINQHSHRLCRACKDKKERQEYQEYQEETKRDEDPIERYSNKILGIIPEYESSYEEQKKIEVENWEIRSKAGHELLERESEVTRDKPEGMTKKQWDKERRRKKRLLREEDKEARANSELSYHGTPNHLIEKRIRKIPCECEAEKMRHGIICKTCRLLVKVNDYMLSLFKDADLCFL